ncbi:MAG: HrpE/YscL family type III secretion apparatus protein [Simkaniaceae bacterium]|nr:HrpE/YscL family type III secretion apparatus protein [Simkaniaceae bacterium]
MKYFSLLNEDTVHPATNAKIIPEKQLSQLLDAAEVLERAQDDAKKFLEDTKIECKKLTKKAKEKGYQEGLTEFNTALLALDEHIKKMNHDLQQAVLPIALKAAKKIVGAELKSHPEIIIDIVTQALKPVTESHIVKIIVNKDDKVILDKEKENIKKLLDQVQNFSIVERADIAKGDCIIETEAGIINASLDNQWRALESAFTAFMKR